MIPHFHASHLEDIYNSFLSWVIHSRRSVDTWLIAKDHILKPPFTIAPFKTIFEEQTQETILELSIGGANEDTLIFGCNRIVASRYRDQLSLFLMSPDNIVLNKTTIAPLGVAKQRILEAFPPNSKFTSEELYEKVRRAGDNRIQAHARRRWKELKYDSGFDVDYDRASNLYWRGPNETPIVDPVVRPNDNALKRDYWHSLAEVSMQLHSDTIAHCNYCDARVVVTPNTIEDQDNLEIPNQSDQIEFDSVGLLDHRRPVFQGGGDEVENLQIFCQTCNNRKNSVCRNCPYGHKCDTCVWAFPDRYKASRIVLFLNTELAQTLRNRLGVLLEKEIENILQRLAEHNS